MKKIGVLFVFVMLLFSLSFISGQESPPGAPDVPVMDEDMQTVQKGIEVIPLDPETGEIDKEKIGVQKTKAEERIEAINEWINEHAWWLKQVFGMVPEVSWLFFINFFIILILLVNFRNIFVLYSSFSENIATIVGIALAVIATQIGVTVKTSKFLLELMSQWWFQWILIILAIITLMISFGIGKWAKKRRLEKYKALIAMGAKDSKRLQKYVNKIEGGLKEEGEK